MTAFLLFLAGCAGAPPEQARGPIRVLLTTELGDVEIEVDTIRAPLSGGAFLRHVDLGTFQGGSFYRVVRSDNDRGNPKVEIVQGGQSAADPAWPTIPLETTKQTGLLHRDGTVSLARAEPGSSTGAVFVFCIGDQPALDFGGRRNPDGQGFAAFGRVTRGMDLVRKIQKMETLADAESAYFKGQLLKRPVRIIRATRLMSTGAR